MIKPWVFEFFPAPREPGATEDPQQSADYFNWYLDLWPRAEPLGYEGIFFSEHHFGLAYSPCPNLLIAQVAARTRTIRLGVMGVVLPYHQPWKVVEEIGMLDHLTQGRLEIGTAAGIPQEMAQVGLSVAEARERNDEAIEIMDAALAAPVISHHGKYWSFIDLRLVPRPLQRPHPPIWVTVISEDSARKAARRGAKICTGFHPTQRVKSIFDAYRDEASRVGTPSGPDQFALRRQISIGTDDAATRAAARVREQVTRSRLPIRACPRRSVRCSIRPRRTHSPSVPTSSSPARRTTWRNRRSRSAARSAPAISSPPSIAPPSASHCARHGKCSARRSCRHCARRAWSDGGAIGRRQR